MIPIQQIRENTELVIKSLAKRNVDYSSEIKGVLELDLTRKKVQQQVDELLSELNGLSKEIGELFKSGKKDEAEIKKQRTIEIKDKTKALTDKQKELEDQIRTALSAIPNAPHESVHAGKGDQDNEEILREGEIPALFDGALPHWELAAKYDLIDFDLGSKITGAGFPVYKGKGAKLQRALITYFLDSAEKAGYQEIIPPLLVNEDSGFGTGQLPDKDGQMYHAQVDNLFLIPTAEVPVTNIFRDVILKEEDFPVKCVAYTPCFRREAGSYGKDVRGLNRLHQFDKVEIVQIQQPDQSYQTLGIMVEYVQDLIRSLGLPFRALKLCGGDLGTAAAKTIDLEVYSAAQERWLEVSSVSNFEAYQANRLKLRFKGNEQKTQLAHTLNGSALALPRIYAALLENNQTHDGIVIPEVLRPYTGFKLIN
ncbi:MAG: serine--tRNA ligase [Vicingaceae bacterium]